jgi:hypothetical protein
MDDRRVRGNLGRTTFTGPGLANINVDFAKATKIPWFTPEGASVELRAEIFNLFNRFNRVNLDQPVGERANPLVGHSTSQGLPRAPTSGFTSAFKLNGIRRRLIDE